MSDALPGALPAVPLPDILAFIWFMACWVGYSFYTDCGDESRRPVVRVLHQYRVRWMERMLYRDNRMADITIVTAHMRGGMMYGTITSLILAGVMAVLGSLG